MKKKALLLATALSALVHQGNFASTKHQIVDHTKHQITINFAEQANKQDAKTVYVAGTQEQLNDKHPDSLNHQAIITMQMDDILAKYGKEKGLDIIRQHMLEEINNFRKENRLPQLATNDILQKTAQEYAEYISQEDYAHTYSQGSRHTAKTNKTDPIQRSGKNKYPSPIIGEVITYTPTKITIQQALENWKKSPPHRATLLSKSYIELGIGVFEKYRVINLGNPKYF